MKRTLYIEGNAGISGDMFVAAMLDLGVDEKELLEALESLPLDGYQIEISRVKKSGLDVCDFNVILEIENHDHDEKYLHSTHHAHSEKQHTHKHIHRGMKEITEIIEASSITENAKRIAKRIFGILAESEAQAHGVSVEQVHFHEVGAVDSIVDIVAAAVCIDLLQIEEVAVPRICEGRGNVRCQHGILPIPVPAVSNIVARHQIHLHILDVEGELVTPTGAAIVAAIKTTEQLPQVFQIQKIGMGAGKRKYQTSGILRVMLLEE